MIFLACSISELTRAEKKTMYNCFTTSADINLFADTLQITVTLTSTKSASCDIPHGVFVSLQIDSLGSYEPSAYVQDFAYDSPQQIRLACADPVECAKIKAAESGTIVLETKTHATFVPAGSIRVSKGLSSSCFHDNDSFVELYQGAVVLVLYPTFTCKDSIAKDQMGQLKLNTMSKVKMYITYTDNSITIHDQLAITVQQDLFVPTTRATASSTPLRIKLSNPTISQFFVQTMTNGVLSKDMTLFQANLEFTNIALLKINAQVTMNLYKQMGIAEVYNRFDMQLLSNGFVVYKTLGSQTAAANNYLQSLGVTSYQIQYVFTYHDVKKTNEFRMRLFGQGSSNYLFNDIPVQSTCETRFKNQQCDLLLQKLKEIPFANIQTFISYMFYANDILVTNYTQIISDIYGSCFSDGILTYDNATKKLEIEFAQNKGYTCYLAKNDALAVKILLADTSQVLKTLNIDYVPGTQRFELSGFDLQLQPEIHIQFIRDGMVVDVISLSNYQMNSNNKLIIQQILIVVYILVVHLGFLVLYWVWNNVILKKIQKYTLKKIAQIEQRNKLFKQFAGDDELV
ncbi:Conserved_hypothetical protein [Hexamita inflata]|uniref:Transmembrane protein n=1 Tax=Hexamita inflata TaxID=28002 RepID=A0AA86RBR8_9EUKA|nr:Conserved hypothetical protein [Hexamita inflata]